jgi:xanthine/uracil permease
MRRSVRYTISAIVASRFVVGTAGVFLIMLGLAPKLAAIVSVMLNPVLEDAVVIIFGIIRKLYRVRNSLSTISLLSQRRRHRTAVSRN